MCVFVCLCERREREVDDPCAIWSTMINEIVSGGVRLLYHLTNVHTILCESSFLSLSSLRYRLQAAHRFLFHLSSIVCRSGYHLSISRCRNDA